jgi:hypothetical protein
MTLTYISSQICDDHSLTPHDHSAYPSVLYFWLTAIGNNIQNITVSCHTAYSIQRKARKLKSRFQHCRVGINRVWFPNTSISQKARLCRNWLHQACQSGRPLWAQSIQQFWYEAYCSVVPLYSLDTGLYGHCDEKQIPDDAANYTSGYSPQLKAKAVPPHATEALGERRGIAPTHSWHRHKMEVSGQRHALGRDLGPGKGPPVPIVQEAGWGPEPVWIQRLQEKSFRLCWGRSSIARSSCP